MSATQPASPTTFPCENCGHWFTLGTLACANCGALVYRRRLEQLAGEATRLEPAEPLRAALVWRQCLELLPPQSPQYQAIAQRVGALTSGLTTPASDGSPHRLTYGGEINPQAPVKPPDPLLLSLAKTFGSMLLCVLVYTVLFRGPLQARLLFAAGLTGLILVHELGHVIAMRYYKLSASPPIFIPFLGAVINMRQQPRNAWVEAVVGIGGPALGTVGVLVTLGLLFWLRLTPGSDTYEIVRELAFIGAMLNLFNLLPFPPLDGGRISAAVSPWIWLAGVVGLGVLLYTGILPLYLAVLVAISGLPRIATTLRHRAARNNPYYDIPKVQSVTMAICYVSLAALLTGLFWFIGKSAILG